MSIPPLVCSTPPPPEQCDDDKDPEDFDLQYNLSQYDDDDSNDYNYGSFGAYNDLQPTASGSNQNSVILNTIEHVNDLKTTEKQIEFIDSNEISVEKTKSRLINDEDINIEDLNLKLDQEDTVELDIQQNNEDKPENFKINNTTVTEHNDIQTNIDDSSSKNPELLESPEREDRSTEPTIFDHANIPETLTENIVEDQIHATTKTSFENSSDSENLTDDRCEKQLDVLHNALEDRTNVADDDFDDFQFINSNDTNIKNNSELPILNNFENPWENEDTSHVNFGEFTANFDDNNTQPQSDSFNIEPSVGTEPETSQVKNDSDDDFGDFDDFKSSNNEVESQEDSSIQHVPVFSIKSTDSENQVMERINKILSSIFEDEILEPVNICEGQLDLLLNETWGHLMETDVRQPYIVNWNNSLAQKTLLKALCIDSRNILFGPKWSYNMPKYAANLSTAPLQPQKQPTPSSISQSELTNSEKVATKTWTDPFATNGQESCNTENENAVMEPRPTDLDVFEATVPTKSDKIFSNTISVQPIRQINLPDTHIFTPTDSETPRSKTIHYDCGPAPTVLLPTPVVADFKNEPDKPVTSFSTVPDSENTESEYWEYQDFKGSPNENLPNEETKDENNVSNNSEAKPNITYQTQLLQPIKLDPVMPTLNWPAPGEVSETFDDFSDFVSSSTNNTDTENTIIVSAQEEQKVNIELNSHIDSSNKNNKLNEESKIDDNIDDDFDTFQSALPSNKDSFEFKFKSLDSSAIISQGIAFQEKINNFNVIFPKDNNTNNDISLTNHTMAYDALSVNLDNNLTANESTTLPPSKSSGAQPNNLNILQPTTVNVTGQMHTSISSGLMQTQQKSGQILQPLSLESYSQINWPNPGIDLQDLSRFNPVETLPSLKSDPGGSSHSKMASPIHSQKSSANNQLSDDEIWGEFVSSKPKQQSVAPKKVTTFIDDDEWTDFVSSPSAKPQNGLNTISLNVHTNLNMQKSSSQNSFSMKNKPLPLDIPSLNYVTPKTGSHHKSYNEHFQNL